MRVKISSPFSQQTCPASESQQQKSKRCSAWRISISFCSFPHLHVPRTSTGCPLSLDLAARTFEASVNTSKRPPRRSSSSRSSRRTLTFKRYTKIIANKTQTLLNIDYVICFLYYFITFDLSMQHDYENCGKDCGATSSSLRTYLSTWHATKTAHDACPNITKVLGWTYSNKVYTRLMFRSCWQYFPSSKAPDN